MPNAPIGPHMQAGLGNLANPLIERSWHRCRSEHANQLAAEPLRLPRGELQDLLAHQARLLDAAKPALKQLAGLAEQAESVVLLADARGVILRADGNTGFLARAEQVALQPGVDWSESHRGTNAIGTALIEGTPVRVHGPEHFLRDNRILSCNAAPIRSGRGELLGVLDISHDANVVQAYTLELARWAARHISNRQLQARPGQHRLLLQRDTELLDITQRGLLLIEDGHIVSANETALELLGAGWRELLERPLSDFLEDWQRLRGPADVLHSRHGERLYATLDAPAGPLQPPARSARTRNAPQAASVGAQPRSALPRLPATMLPLFERSVRVLDAGLSTMLLGETGAGKEIYARHLHQASRWHRGPFIAVNCTALPESLIEAELFGYEPGAFTGARRGGSRGLLREAHGGVLFLDEIGDMPLGLQARLLRVLQERVVQPLGSAEVVPVDFAVVCATHRNLQQCIAEGSFRADLFYRLQDFCVALPPLREREDLADFIRQEFAACLPQGSRARLAPATLAELAHHPWPGNYRQLRAVLRTLALFAPPAGEVLPDELPSGLQAAPFDAGAAAAAVQQPGPGEPARAPKRLDSLRDDAIERSLRAHNGNVSRAARALGVHRSTLYRYLERSR